LIKINDNSNDIQSMIKAKTQPLHQHEYSSSFIIEVTQVPKAYNVESKPKDDIIMDIDRVHHETYSKLLVIFIDILLSIPDVYFSSSITNLNEIIQK